MALAAVVAVAALPLAAHHVAAVTPPIHQPVIDGDWADPDVVFDPVGGWGE